MKVFNFFKSIYTNFKKNRETKKTRPPKHRHKKEWKRVEYLVGTNHYIDGKEIQKKVYRYDIVCTECHKTIDIGDVYDLESWMR
jgi:hypothetical protein